MEIRLILTTFVVSFGFPPVHPNDHQANKLVTNSVNHGHKFEENFRNFFDSIKKNDENMTRRFRAMLEVEAAIEKRAFDTAKDELQSARQKKADKQRNVNKDDDVNIPKADSLKRRRRAFFPASDDTVSKNYCEYEGRFVRRGAQKYIPELDKVVVCRSVKPRWVSVYACSVLLNTPEKYADMTGRLAMAVTKLCEMKPGATTNSSTTRGLSDGQPVESETRTTLVDRLRGHQDPFTPSSDPSRGRKTTLARGKTTLARGRKTTLHDGELHFALNDEKDDTDSTREEEASLRAAGLWLTTGADSAEGADDYHQDQASVRTFARRMQYPKTTLPNFDDIDLAEASPFFINSKKSTKSVGGRGEDSATESSSLDSDSDVSDPAEDSADLRVFDEDKQRELDMNIGLDNDEDVEEGPGVGPDYDQ